MAQSDVTERAPIEQMAFGAMSAKIVYAAAELGVPDALAGGERTSAALAEELGAHPPSLRRLLRALAGLGVVDQTGPDSFELAAVAEPLRSGAPDSVHALITMLCGPENWASWGELVASVRTGQPGWNLAHGLSWVDYYEGHPERSANFNRAMSEHTRAAGPGILAAAELSRFGTLIDVGGGDGTLIAPALRDNPGLRGGILDLPACLEDARATLEAAGVADRCRLFAGDFFDAVPAGADAYLLKQVLHDWDDQPAKAILRSVRGAMPSRSTLLLAERLLPDEASPADAPVLLVDVLMLVVTGGRERTEAEFAALLAEAGFEPARFSEPLPPYGYRVIEATPI